MPPCVFLCVTSEKIQKVASHSIFDLRRSDWCRKKARSLDFPTVASSSNKSVRNAPRETHSSAKRNRPSPEEREGWQKLWKAIAPPIFNLRRSDWCRKKAHLLNFSTVTLSSNESAGNTPRETHLSAKRNRHGLHKMGEAGGQEEGEEQTEAKKMEA